MVICMRQSSVHGQCVNHDSNVPLENFNRIELINNIKINQSLNIVEFPSPNPSIDN